MGHDDELLGIRLSLRQIKFNHSVTLLFDPPLGMIFEHVARTQNLDFVMLMLRRENELAIRKNLLCLFEGLPQIGYVKQFVCPIHISTL